MKSTPPTPSYWVLLFGYIVVGIPFSVGVIDTAAAIQASTDTQETLGTVVAFERRQGSSRSGGGTVRAPVVEYQVAGQNFRCTGAVATNLPIHAVGDRVSVLYKVNEPGTAFIDSFFDRWLGPLAFTVVGFGFLVILVVATIQKIRGPRAAAISAASHNRPTSRKRRNRCRT